MDPKTNDSTSQPNVPSIEPPKLNRKFKKKWLILALGLLIIAAIIAMFSTKKGNPQTASNPKQTTITGLDVAKQAAGFLDKTILPNGDFTPFFICTKSDCQPQSPSTQLSYHNGFMAEAYLKLSQETNNTQYKNQADKAMAFILDKCSQDDQVCLNSLQALYAWYKLTNDPKYLQAMQKAGKNLLNNEPVSQAVNGELSESVFMMYDATKDTKYKDRLQVVANKIITGQVDKNNPATPPSFFSAFYKEGNLEVSTYKILAANWYIAAFKATNDPIYLKAAQNFFDNAKLYNHLDVFKKIGKPLDLSTIEYLLDLADVSTGADKTAYQLQAKAIAQIAITDLWDTPQNKKYNGDFGFLTNYSLQSANQKSLIYNGIRIRQFLRLKDQVFKLQ